MKKVYQSKYKIAAIICLLVMAMTVCAAPDDQPAAATTAKTATAATPPVATLNESSMVSTIQTGVAPDPFENFNRAMSNVNDSLDKYVAKPVAKFYVKIIPAFLVRGIHNFFTNLGTLPTIGNDVLQGRFYQALSDTWRFGINSTVGLGGFFDPATSMGLPYHNETFDLTLAYWGWKRSTYLVLPLLGPGTVRRAISIPPDWVMSAYFWLPNNKYTWALYGLQLLDTRAALLPYDKTLNTVMLDPYSFYKNAYLQRQAYLIRQNEQPSTQDIKVNTAKVWGPYGR